MLQNRLTQTKNTQQYVQVWEMEQHSDNNSSLSDTKQVMVIYSKMFTWD